MSGLRIDHQVRTGPHSLVATMFKGSETKKAIADHTASNCSKSANPSQDALVASASVVGSCQLHNKKSIARSRRTHPTVMADSSDRLGVPEKPAPRCECEGRLMEPARGKGD